MSYTPRFYFYPGQSGPLQTLDLTRISRLEQIDKVLEIKATNGYAGSVRFFQGTQRRIRITMERISLLTSAGTAQHRHLQALISHLQTGGLVGLSLDPAKSWAGYPAGTWSRGASYVSTWKNAFWGWESAATLVSGDEVVIESSPIQGWAERLLTSGLSRGGLQVDFNGDTLAFDWKNADSPMVRWHGFYPCLQLADVERPPITNEYGRVFSIDLTLEVIPDIFYSQKTGQQRYLALAGSTAPVTQGPPSLEEMIRGIQKKARAARIMTAGPGRI